MRTALTIAGSDSGGGAGIQADLKTFAAHGVYGLSAVTAITAQNTLGVQGVWPLAPDVVTAQIDAVVSDFSVDATKIGMLATEANVRAVAAAIRRAGLSPIVLDTVLVSTSGAPLLEPDGVDALRRELIPLATVVTVNVPEATALTGFAVASVDDARRAAVALVGMGAAAAVVKGGHLPGAPVDVVCDGRQTIDLPGERIHTAHTHGTGCTFASALAARLALGDSIPEAALRAKAYVARAIAGAPALGRGRGPIAHFAT